MSTTIDAMTAESADKSAYPVAIAPAMEYLRRHASGLVVAPLNMANGV